MNSYSQDRYGGHIDAMHQAERSYGWYDLGPTVLNRVNFVWNDRHYIMDKRNTGRLKAYRERAFKHDFAPGV